MRIGIICPSEIAIRRFMPALQQCKDMEFVGIGVYTREERYGSDQISEEEFQADLQKEIDKAYIFIKQYGGKIFGGYTEIVISEDIDALYIPLPPALHFKWAKLALEHGKHVLIEKPCTISLSNSKELVKIASKNEVVLHENYAFDFHEQLDAIDKIIQSGEIGNVRLYRMCFGFPRREENDFRYNKKLGGGALIDAGGYTIHYAIHLLGETAELKFAQSNYLDDFEVDMYGSAVLVNANNMTVQVAFGMDNNYKCELEVWGSQGHLITGRVFTAPAGFIPTAIISNKNGDKEIQLPADDTFFKSIKHFVNCTKNDEMRKENYRLIIKQAEFINEFKCKAGWK